jgi:hypothetical protein
MTSNAWFVLFPQSRIPAKNAVLEALRKIKGARVETDGEAMSFTVITAGGSFGVGLNVTADVAIETCEAVERAGGGRDDASTIAGYDARFELLFNRDEIGDLFNPLLTAAERLAELTRGVVYESDNRAFQ